MGFSGTLVFGGAAGDALIRSFAQAMERADVPLVVVDLDPHDSDDRAHEARFAEAAADVPGRPVLGGFSLGARIAARVGEDLGARGLLCLGYPFHRFGAPEERHGLETVRDVVVPTCIIQGSRDSHGSLAEVRGYGLPAGVQMTWLEDGNHRFVPRARSGHTEGEHLEAAVSAAISFLRRLPASGGASLPPVS